MGTGMALTETRQIAHEVMAAYRTAWRHLRPLFAAYLFVRLLALAIFAPLATLLLSLAIRTSGRSAFTDQEIAYFLATPAGLAGMAVAGALLIVAFVLDISLMTAILRTGEHTMTGAVQAGLRLAFGRVTVLFRFALRLLAYVVAIALPFLVVASAIAWFALRSYDINYYLTYWPPTFIFAAIAIALVACAAIVVLIRQLSGWCIALHLIVFRRISPRLAFGQSRQMLFGHRRKLVASIVAWIAARIVLGLAPTIVAGLLIEFVSDAFGARLHIAAILVIAVLIVWAFANALLHALSNGALSDLLYRLYLRATRDEPEPEGAFAPPTRRARTAGLPAAGIALGALAVVFATIVGANRLLDRIQTQRTVEIIAHRGAAAIRPENTLASIEKALEDKADWVEIDVQETADGEVIVAHDSDFMKLAGVNLKTWNATMDDIARIDIGSWFDPAWSNERTPTLRQVLDKARGRGKVIIELKYYGHDVKLEQRVAAIVDSTGMAANIAVMSLKAKGIDKMHALRPDWHYGILAAKAIGNLAALNVQFLAVNTGQVSTRLIKQAHAQGKQVYAWTVDDPLMMSRMISMGIDGLITNDPALARHVMDARNGIETYQRLMLWLVDQFRIGSFDFVADEKDG